MSVMSVICDVCDVCSIPLMSAAARRNSADNVRTRVSLSPFALAAPQAALLKKM